MDVYKENYAENYIFEDFEEKKEIWKACQSYTEKSEKSNQLLRVQ